MKIHDAFPVGCAVFGVVKSAAIRQMDVALNHDYSQRFQRVATATPELIIIVPAVRFIRRTRR